MSLKRVTLIHGRLYRDGDPAEALWQIEPDGAVVMDDGVITRVGPSRHVMRQETDLGTVIDVDGRAVIPGLIDCHTHVPFAGWRVDEYEARLRGQSYEAIARKKGGIVRSARQWQEATDAEILAMARRLAQEALLWGTTAMEMKSGYGLSVDQELRALRLIRRLAAELPQHISATGLFFHAVPPETAPDDWIRTVREVLLPAALAEGLVSAVDAFIERTAFSVTAVAQAFEALPASLPIRLHTNQFSRQGGIELAVRLSARAVDHLEYLEPDEIEILARHGIAAVLMPGAAFYTRQPYAPARALLDRGVRVALATDLNPGTSPIGNLPTVMAMAVNAMAMSPDEALAGVTRQAAYVLGIQDTHGSIEPGRRGDLVVLDADTVAMIPYRLGHNPVDRVIVGGRPVTPKTP
ncbi:imidazolonepropionase [Sulfobacillus acidophilus TPY]|uniref:Imidazolonepropionase n=1 Tax=Sulfobacillus acidophilus (strain ATCC 700253 / DSM 10332 / NAL) TaxID=679936 RepID=G8TVM1_SULAD|nr:imidazolonepropionase [Sulfobacillus acidophilus TPY]AEW03660.1 imidazolonepropionase [Sulfobacillus acidophilus DSM 10332]